MQPPDDSRVLRDRLSMAQAKIRTLLDEFAIERIRASRLEAELALARHEVASVALERL